MSTLLRTREIPEPSSSRSALTQNKSFELDKVLVPVCSCWLDGVLWVVARVFFVFARVFWVVPIMEHVCRWEFKSSKVEILKKCK